MSKLHFKCRADFQGFFEKHASSGKAWHVLVLHDDSCTTSVCVCDPEYVVEILSAETLMAGAKLQEKWVRDNTS